ncbi:hypothetical protein [Paenibacillus sp. WLX2291]|uniref:hypothetical protein n=1 Tax=Paenibacillus sp. WLX2291 TaxID=3296934 RepID=UPI00398413DF
MIKIAKTSQPVELTKSIIKSLTKQFKSTKKAVWKKQFIEDALLESSHSKCSYCECKLNTESKYMEVEHFRDKFHHPNLVVVWDNLLPSCKRCNGLKSSHNVRKYPIINPTKMDPRDHLAMNSYRFFSKTIIGQTTIDLLLLNDTKKVVMARFEIAEQVMTSVDEILEKCDRYLETRSIIMRNKIVQGTKNILYEGSPHAEYSASVSTALLQNTNLYKIIDFLKQEKLWDSELQKLLDALRETAFYEEPVR